MSGRFFLRGTPLGDAIRDDDEKLLEKLLSEGADPEEPDWDTGDGLSPLMIAVKLKKIWAVRRMVKEKGLNSMNPKGETALIMAAGDDSEEITEILTTAGANTEIRNGMPFRRTPLAVAARNGACSTIKALIRAGADPEARDDNGQTPMEIALKWGELKAAETLIDEGAIFRQPSDNGTSYHVESEEWERIKAKGFASNEKKELSAFASAPSQKKRAKL